MVVEDDTILSYNIPEKYEEHSIMVPPGMKLFKTFSSFDLESAVNCKYDFLRIVDISGKQLCFIVELALLLFLLNQKKMSP